VDPLDIIHSHGADAMRLHPDGHDHADAGLADAGGPGRPALGAGVRGTPVKITTPAGHVVAAPIQSSPKDPSKKIVSSYGMTSGLVKPTPEMPLARTASSKFDSGRNLWQQDLERLPVRAVEPAGAAAHRAEWTSQKWIGRPVIVAAGPAGEPSPQPRRFGWGPPGARRGTEASTLACGRSAAGSFMVPLDRLDVPVAAGRPEGRNSCVESKRYARGAA